MIKDKVEGEISGKRKLLGNKAKVLSSIAVAMALYHILYVGHIFDYLGIYIPNVSHAAISLAFTFTLVFLGFPSHKKAHQENKIPWYDILFIIIGSIVTLYIAYVWKKDMHRIALGNFYEFEHVFSFIIVLLVLESTRRVIGLPMVIVSVIFLLHMWFGSYFSGALYVPEIGIPRISELLVFGINGIYGIAYQTASTIVIMFIIFGAFILTTGFGEYFMDIAKAAFGRFRGGPAKISVLSSALFGTVSGATTANIVVDGVFTIPIMKKAGYSAEWAAAIETVTSNGGQIMPPVMGVVAFIMAEWLQIPYFEICKAAIIPALLYFLAVFVMIDAEAIRLKISGLPKAECPPFIRTFLKGWFFFLPIAALIYLIGVKMYQPETSALYTIGILLLLSGIKKLVGLRIEKVPIDSKMMFSTIKFIGSSLKTGSLAILPAAAACACAGLIIGTMGVSQIGIKLSDGLLTLSGGNQFMLLVLTAIAAMILGMGMSSIPVYIMVVIGMAPALVKFGILPLAAHFFVFWFSIVSFITPPVAIGAYVAAGIAGSNPIRTGFIAMKLGITTYMLPFMFVYSSAFLLMGPIEKILLDVITAVVGVTLLAWGIVGESFWGHLGPLRIIFLVGGLLLMMPDVYLTILGSIFGALGILVNIFLSRKREK